MFETEPGRTDGGSGPLQPPAETPPPEPAEPSARELEQRRLDEALDRVAELEARIAQLEEELGGAQRELADAERRRLIEAALHEAGVIDAETALLLIDPDAGSTAESAEEAVGALREAKPFLFRRRPIAARVSTPAALGATVDVRDTDELDGLRDQARRSGDRRTLLAYLRQRRAV